MKRILVTSDSHMIKTTFNKVMENLHKDINVLIHLGDVCQDINSYKKLYPDIEYLCVTGNCDFSDNSTISKVTEFDGVKIFFTHGHYFDVKYGNEKIFYAAKEKNADICLFGHTHFPIIFKEENIIFMNPGSISYPRGIMYKSYGIINIYDDSTFEVSVVALENEIPKVIYSEKSKTK